MKIYRVSLFDEHGEHDEHSGYQYFSNKKDATTLAKANCQDPMDFYSGKIMTEFEVKLNKKSVIDALNKYGSHPDNG